MRLVTYVIVALCGALLVLDTYIGEPLNTDQQAIVDEAIRYIHGRHLLSDASLLQDVQSDGHFRNSRFLDLVSRLSSSGEGNFGFHAFTPILSRTRIFIGEDFPRLGIQGQASVLVHEAQHLRRHRKLFLRGFPRKKDETEAYIHQYATYKRLGLQDTGNSEAYWDMMLGMIQYVIPTHPEYARRIDIQQASRSLAGHY